MAWNKPEGLTLTSIVSFLAIMGTLMGSTWFLASELGGIKTNVAILATELHAHMNQTNNSGIIASTSSLQTSTLSTNPGVVRAP